MNTKQKPKRTHIIYKAYFQTSMNILFLLLITLKERQWVYKLLIFTFTAICYLSNYVTV